MGLCRAYVDTQVPQLSNGSIKATTAGSSTLAAATTAGSMYITDIIINNGATAGNFLFGYAPTLIAPTGSGILIQPMYVGVNSTVPITNIGTPFKVPPNNQFIVTAVSGTTISVTANYYIAP